MQEKNMGNLRRSTVILMLMLVAVVAFASERVALWPEGENTSINVHPADYCCGNSLYNAFGVELYWVWC